jgi:hypothetical protein
MNFSLQSEVAMIRNKNFIVAKTVYMHHSPEYKGTVPALWPLYMCEEDNICQIIWDIERCYWECINENNKIMENQLRT